MAASEVGNQHEVAYTQIEARLRTVMQDLLQPTIHRASLIQSDVDSIKAAVTQQTRDLQEVQLGQFKAVEQVQTISSFNAEMRRWDVERRQHETAIDLKLQRVQQTQDEFNYSLEQKESTLHHLHRSVERLAAELNHTREEQESQRSHFEARMDDQSRRANIFKSEVDVRLAGLELKHHALSDELRGEMTGLARISGELKKTNAAFDDLEVTVSESLKGKAEAEQFEKVRTDVHKMVREANASVADMKRAVGNVVSDVKEHFRTVSQTIAAHNANFVGEVREQYQAELANAASLRDEVQEIMVETERNIAGLDSRLAAAATRAEALAKEARGEVEELNKRRKRDKLATDDEFKALKHRLRGVFDNSDNVVRGLEHIHGVIQAMLESDLMGCSVDLQDSLDRRRMALWGAVSGDDNRLVRSRQTEPQLPRQEVRSRSAAATKPSGLKGGPGTLSARGTQEPSVKVEPRCLSCSGQAPLVLSAFKMACLQYMPSPVEHGGLQHERDDLLQQRKVMLQQALETLMGGPPNGFSLEEETVMKAVDDELLMQSIGTPLADSPFEGTILPDKANQNTSLRLPSLPSAPNVVQTPRAVTVR